jgi:hypothetical protein
MAFIASIFLAALPKPPGRDQTIFCPALQTLDRFQNRAGANTVHGEIAKSRPWRHRMPGNRNILFLIIGALVVVVAVLGYNVYQTKKQPEGLQINVGPNGLKIQNK